MNHADIVILSAVRTPIGKYGGGLKDLGPSELAASCVKEAVKRAGVAPADVGTVAFGNVIHTEPSDMYLSRVAAIKGGLPVEAPALTLNRMCGSGLEAIISVARTIVMGDAEVGVAGGAECMSRGQYWLPQLRWGQRMSDAAVVDAMVAALTDPFDKLHMGVGAEGLATKFGITRREQDEFAARSHERANDAIKQCVFKEEILPFEFKTKAGTTVFDTDEHPRPDATFENLSKLKPAFDKNGTVTAGNASGINDGAAAVVVMDRHAAEEKGLKPIARLVGYANAGIEPKLMGLGPVPAVKSVLARTGLTLDQIDIIELNEAFAAQSLAVIRELDLPLERTNIHGGAIALGHPIGASGAILTVKALHELKRRGHGRALVTLCIGGGQGIAAVFEAIEN